MTQNHLRTEEKPEHAKVFTDKLVLRNVIASDLQVFYQHQLDPDASYKAAFISRNPADREAFSSHWKKILADPTVTIETILLGGSVAGWIGTWVDMHWLGKPEVTYWIGREYWGKGIATQALSQFLQQQRVRPIYARAAKDNFASLRFLEKCGFTILGFAKGLANAHNAEIEEAQLELK